jgi:hypothetical protein
MRDPRASVEGTRQGYIRFYSFALRATFGSAVARNAGVGLAAGAYDASLSLSTKTTGDRTPDWVCTGHRCARIVHGDAGAAMSARRARTAIPLHTLMCRVLH